MYLPSLAFAAAGAYHVVEMNFWWAFGAALLAMLIYPTWQKKPPRFYEEDN